MKEATIESKVDALIGNNLGRRKSFKSRKIWGIPMVWVLSIVVASMMVSGAVYVLWDQIGIDITGTFNLEGQTQRTTTILYDAVELDNYSISLTDMDITEINCGEEFTFTHTLDATNNFDKDYVVTFDLTNMPINGGGDPNSEYYGFFFEVREHGTTNVITGFDLDKTKSVSFDYWYCLYPSYEKITTFPFDLRIQLLEKGSNLGHSSTITMNIFERDVSTQTVIWMVTQVEGESIGAEYQWSLLNTSGVNLSGATLTFADNTIDNYINAGDTFTVVASENGYFVFMLTDMAGQTIYKSSSTEY